MENKELIFAYSDYQHCILHSASPYEREKGCEGCRAHGTFCSYIWRLDNAQWILRALADLSGEPFEKVYCGYRGSYCAKCDNPICKKEFSNSYDRSKYKAHICDEICAKALKTICEAENH